MCHVRGAFPEQAIRFYREAGYDFLGISDHNVYADSHRVRKVGGKGKRIVKQEIFDAYKREFPGCVETETAADGSLNVVIQPYAKMRTCSTPLRARRTSMTRTAWSMRST